jgi:hypothetical protein
MNWILRLFRRAWTTGAEYIIYKADAYLSFSAVTSAVVTAAPVTNASLDIAAVTASATGFKTRD